MADKTHKYEVRLESPADGQFRIMRMRAASPGEAQAIAEAREAERVAFTLSEPELEIIQRLHRFAAEDEIDPRTGGLYPPGTVVGPDPAARGKLHMHYLTEPYRVVDVQEIK